jgi:hypothetical protein
MGTARTAQTTLHNQTFVERMEIKRILKNANNFKGCGLHACSSRNCLFSERHLISQWHLCHAAK